MLPQQRSSDAFHDSASLMCKRLDAARVSCFIRSQFHQQLADSFRSDPVGLLLARRVLLFEALDPAAFQKPAPRFTERSGARADGRCSAFRWPQEVAVAGHGGKVGDMWKRLRRGC